MTDQLIQALHAGISRRDWHATETAANALRAALSAAAKVRAIREGDGEWAMPPVWRAEYLRDDTLVCKLDDVRAMAKRASPPSPEVPLSLDGFAESLASVMEARNVTVRGLSETLGIDKSAISRMRTGKPVWARHFIAMWNWVAASPAATGGEKE